MIYKAPGHEMLLLNDAVTVGNLYELELSRIPASRHAPCAREKYQRHVAEDFGVASLYGAYQDGQLEQDERWQKEIDTLIAPVYRHRVHGYPSHAQP